MVTVVLDQLQEQPHVLVLVAVVEQEASLLRVQQFCLPQVAVVAVVEQSLLKMVAVRVELAVKMEPLEMDLEHLEEQLELAEAQMVKMHL
jgi:hypothetical protein